MGDAAHAMVPFYGQGMNCVSTSGVPLLRFVFLGAIDQLHRSKLSNEAPFNLKSL